MGKIKSFEDMNVWQDARVLVGAVYRITEAGQLKKDYGLKDQLRRSSVSVMANIAEGFERNGNKEFLQYLSHAKGSVGELRSHLYVASDLGAINCLEHKQIEKQVLSISRQLSGLMGYLRRSPEKGSKYKKVNKHRV